MGWRVLLVAEQRVSQHHGPPQGQTPVTGRINFPRQGSDPGDGSYQLSRMRRSYVECAVSSNNPTAVVSVRHASA